MKKTTLLTAILSGSALMGCAYYFPKTATTAACHGNACRVAVEVIEHELGGCKPYAEPDTLQVRGPGAVVIRWDLDLMAQNKGYRFPNDGIVFDDPSQFECAVAEQGKAFNCTDKHTQAGTYKYTVKVAKGAAACTPHDPYIVNN